MNGIVPQLDSAAKTNAHDDRKLVKREILQLIVDRIDVDLAVYQNMMVQFH